MPSSPVLQQLLRFGIVGSLAALVHFLSVITLVQTVSIKPLVANVIAFLIAFQVSFIGHRYWTFSHTTNSHKESLWRFFLVSVSSFLLNEAMFYCLLRFTAMPYWVSLAIVLVVVAGLTFVMGKFWAFAFKPE